MPSLSGERMIRIFSLIVLLCGLAFAVPDSTKVKELSAKVDSLSAVLHDAQLAGIYAEKTLEATKDANANVRTQFGYFMAAIVGIFGIASLGLGLWVTKKTGEEREAIAIQVRELVNPGFNSQMSTLGVRIEEVSGRFEDHNRSYIKFAGIVENHIHSSNLTFNDHQESLSKIKTDFKIKRESIQDRSSQYCCRLRGKHENNR